MRPRTAEQTRVVLMDSPRDRRTPDSKTVLEALLLYAENLEMSAPRAVRLIIWQDPKFQEFIKETGLKVLP